MVNGFSKFFHLGIRLIHSKTLASDHFLFRITSKHFSSVSL